MVFAAAWKWRDSGNLYDRILFWLSSVSGYLGIVVLPASMSRTGFVALVVSAVAFALTNTESKSYLKSHKWLILSVIAVTFGLVAWDTFAMASYPLAVWQLRLLLAVFLGAAIGVSVKVGKKGRLILVPALVCLSVGSMLVWLPENKHRKEAESKWLEERRFADFEIFDGMADRLTKLYPRLRMKFRYLYDYGYALHKEGRYSESNVILMKGASISSDPMFYNIIGKNFEALGDYDEAERNYIHLYSFAQYGAVTVVSLHFADGNGRKEGRHKAGIVLCAEGFVPSSE